MFRFLFGRPFFDDNVPPDNVEGALKLPTGAAATIGAGVGGGTGTISTVVFRLVPDSWVG